ncbi:FIVAR domain-containing protein [Mycoplasma tullyi]|uniref:FIVAR domain-containing protein n=1 Tax=Mycoplasma tullyi TaxID=1612150 RepID=A0A7D7Y6L6_9MOLU|nr:FIVAR domain-containing protein [Mycoplasma tullyi]QMT98275.1 FIVAR domain-containing protein [Mycoplasma tullyi]
MKRNKILKFVSLLGVGSFVMLAAASCTQTITPVPKSGTSSSNTGMTNSMSSNNANTDNGQEMNSAEQQLATARKTLTDLLNTENDNIALYSDYGKIESDLKTAYDTAKNEAGNANSSLDDLKSIQTALQTAIDKAASEKQTFDNANRALVTAYNQLKITLQSNETTLGSLSGDKYSAIRDTLTPLFNTGSGIITNKLDSLTGERLSIENITKANQDLSQALSKLPRWKQNAEEFDNFKKNALSKDNLSVGSDATNNQDQPVNWSFVGFSVDVSGTSGSSMIPNWNFAQRKVWISNNGTTSLVADPVSSSDVSWIYSLAGTGTKYTLKFVYYGPSTGYLYFPYKLVKAGDMNSVALQYKLNESGPKTINFQSGQAAPISASTNVEGTPSNGGAPMARSSSETLVADGMTDSNNEMNPTPTVADINVAKITLTDLKFGENTLEFSLPTDEDNAAKVAPMIGNMYLTSNVDSQNKIYDQIFGNTNSTTNNQTSVTVDLLKGYGLISGWSTYIGEFKNLTVPNGTSSTTQATTPSYLVGFIAGNGSRTLSSDTNAVKTPTATGAQRTFTIYVNAPMDGDYYFGGSYISSNSQSRSLIFKANDDTNTVTVTVPMASGNFTSLETFNTGNTSSNVVANNMKRTLHLKQGLNKILINGDTNNTPFIGNLTFTLSNSSSSGMPEGGTGSAS